MFPEKLAREIREAARLPDPALYTYVAQGRYVLEVRYAAEGTALRITGGGRYRLLFSSKDFGEFYPVCKFTLAEFERRAIASAPVDRSSVMEAFRNGRKNLSGT